MNEMVQRDDSILYIVTWRRGSTGWQQLRMHEVDFVIEVYATVMNLTPLLSEL